MEYQKITRWSGTTFDHVPGFITKKWIAVHDQSGNAEDRYNPSKQIRFKTSVLRSDLCDFSDVYIVVKGTTTITNADNNAYDKKKKKWLLKIMHRLFLAFQKLILHLLTMLKI